MHLETEVQKSEVEDLRRSVPCAGVLEKAGFAIDVKESTRRAVKYRRGGEIIIVIHEGMGWFDPCSDHKGDVFSLIQHLSDVPFTGALVLAAELVGFVPSEPVWRSPAQKHEPRQSIGERWRSRRKPWAGSATWRYLTGERSLPEPILRAVLHQDRLREGPYGSMWAAHTDEAGVVTGWEERGPEWRGFSAGGSKLLFRLGALESLRLCVTEAAIDAMSLAAFEQLREGSLYLSTGGGWSPSTADAIRILAGRPDTLLVAATDDNAQGQIFAMRLREISEDVGCDWMRMTPPAEDWNEALKADAVEGGEGGKRRRDVPHVRRSRQG